MVVRWYHLATLVVVTLSLIQCERIRNSEIDDGTSSIEFEDLCPCLPVHICPRVYGTRPEDAKYLGEMKKCVDDNAVRCCGASASFVVGTTTAATKSSEDDITKVPVPQPDILSRLNANDVHENEIPDAESEIAKTLIARNESVEILHLEETRNFANFHNKEHLNGETDDEVSESKSVIQTTDAEFQQQQQQSTQESDIVQKSHRQPKTLDSVMMVYPNIMSGIPKTTPKNMPETNEMTMFDQDIGMDLHLVFSKTTIKPEIVEEVQPSVAVEATTKPSFSRFAKRRRQYKPLRKPTTESPAEDTELKTATVRNRTATKQRIRMRNFTSRSTTPEPRDSTTRQPRVKLSTRTPTTQETDSTTRQPRIKLSSRAPAARETDSSTRQPRVRLSTRAPTTQDTDSTTGQPQVRLSTREPTTQESEILMTSDDDKSQQSRFRLFNARHRLNFLRRSSTTANTTTTSTTTTPTTTTESPMEVTTRPTKVRKLPSRVNEDHPKIPVDVRPSKMNETLILVVDTNHRNMLSKVQLALKEAATNSDISEIPRSFAGGEMNNRVKKIEKILAEQMINVYTETNSKQRGGPYRKKEVNNVPQTSTTEQPDSTQTLDSTRSNRGHKKFQMSDLLDKTPVIPMGPNEFRRNVRVRTTTATPVDRAAYDINTTTKRPSRRRRPSSTIQDANTSDTTSNENKEGTNIRRRIVTRRRYNVEDSSTSTLSPVLTTTESIPTTTLVATVSPIVTDTLIATENTTLIESSSDSNEAKGDLVEELDNKSKVESIQIEPVTTADIEDSATSIPTMQNSEALSDFKPSPLWSISTDDQNDFDNKEDNHSYDMNMDERALRNGHRRSSRNTFDQPALYLNGFVPVSSPISHQQIIGPIPKSSKLGNDAIFKNNLPREPKSQFSKN